MVRGTFANIRIKNQLAPGTEGGFTTYWPTVKPPSVPGANWFLILIFANVPRTITSWLPRREPYYDAAMKYKEDGTGLAVLAGNDYGMGSSRDWAAKATI
jgi:aconitate hydratase